jgi:uncharacterized CHY-type Zn-finger protein
MQEAKRRKSVVSFIILLFFFAPLPNVQAQGGEALIETASVSVENYTTFSSNNFSFTFEVHEQIGQSSNVSAEVLLVSPEGVQLSNTTLSVPSLVGFGEANVSATVSGVPFGFSYLTVTLTGGVGENTSTHSTSFTRIVQRLRPLNVSFGGPASVLGDAVDENGSLVGNTSLSDGDFVRFEFPIINHGDVDWSGHVTLRLVNGGSDTNYTLENISVSATTSEQIVVRPTTRLVEGTLGWELNLSMNLSSAEGNHALAGSFEVGPPPLPVLSMALLSNSGNVVSGEVLTVNITVWNNGTAPFNGVLICLLDGDQHLNETLEVLIGENKTATLDTTAKPVLVQCDVAAQRVSEASSLPATLVVTIPSAIFEAAGSSSPSFSGGPWHHGDRLNGNMLLRNTGVLDGRVRLGFTVDGVEYPGEWLTLGEGAAGEISTSAPFLRSGDVGVEWWLESDDGAVEGVDTGAAEFSIKTQQSVSLAIENVERTSDGSVEATLTVNLDPGRSREVLLRTGYETGDSTVFLSEHRVVLEPGVLVQSLSLGKVKGESVVASVSAVDWSIGPGPLFDQASMPSDITEYWVTFGEITDPLRPLEGDLVTVTVTFHQSGPQSEERGELWLVDAYGSLLVRATSPVWDGNDEVSVPLTVTWPKGSTVVVGAVWSIGGENVGEEASYISGQAVVESDVDFPIGAMAMGLALGGALVLVARLRFRAEGSSKPKKLEESSPNQAIKSSPEEKREISCPSCDRRLRVPLTYNGSVGCPDCSTKFNVTAEPATPPSETKSVRDDSEKPDAVKTNSPPAKKAKNDGKVELACPDCSQTLRIPESYRGSVRCPACTKIFKAGEGKVSSE